MPKIVDHVERRAQISDGLIRLAARQGLHTVTMRSVAAESGVSLRLVQYYFRTKARLLHAALLRLEQQSHARWNARLRRLPDPPPLRAFLCAFFAEALPTDEPSRAFHLVWTSYAVMAMTNPELHHQPFAAGPERLQQQLADALLRAQHTGELSPHRDVALESARLLALNHGLGTGVLVGQYTAPTATAIWAHHLDRLLSS